MSAPHRLSLTVLAFLVAGTGCTSTQPAPTLVKQRLADRTYPSVFQAWNPVDVPSIIPLATLDDRLRAAARHDVVWEEPVSQLGYGVQLVLGAVWDDPHGGLATQYTGASLRQALANRQAMLRINPDMIFLMEVRWRDAPGSFLPADSPFWKRGSEGGRVLGWDGGPEPYYLLDYENPAFQDNVARQCRVAVQSGVYDGVMLDWSGHREIIRRVRSALGADPIILVNIHDDIPDGEAYRDDINGSFMECNPEGPGVPPSDFRTTWDRMRRALLFFEGNLREPRLNCLEVWGDRRDERRMRAATTLALTHGNASVLYGDPNPLPTPDHLHDWYPFWDTRLGRPAGTRIDRPDGAFQREFDGGTAVYNPWGNGPVTVKFDTPRRRVSDDSRARQFTLSDADGDFFVP